MTINKGQGQTLDFVGLYLPEPVFCHGQLYVTLSRAKTSTSLKVLQKPSIIDNAHDECTKNMVIKKFFRLHIHKLQLNMLIFIIRYHGILFFLLIYRFNFLTFIVLIFSGFSILHDFRPVRRHLDGSSHFYGSSLFSLIYIFNLNRSCKLLHL